MNCRHTAKVTAFRERQTPLELRSTDATWSGGKSTSWLVRLASISRGAFIYYCLTAKNFTLFKD